MSVKEATENCWIRNNACRAGDFLLRVENSLGDGTFDTFAIIMKRSMWIEIKAPIEPARETSRLFADNHKFSQGQKNFALSIRNAGGACWGFIGTNLRQILIPAGAIEDANDMSVNDLLHVSAWSRNKGLRDNSGELLRYALAQRCRGEAT